MPQLFRVTEKKKDHAIEQGHQLIGYLIKTGGSYQVIAEGRARNLSGNDFRLLMNYP